MTDENKNSLGSPAAESGAFDKVRKYLDHEIEHVMIFPIIIKKFDKDCRMCQILLDRIAKKSQNSMPASLEGKPLAIVQYTTILCAIGMHAECGKDYVMTNAGIMSSCICNCHQNSLLTKKGRQKSRRRI